MFEELKNRHHEEDIEVYIGLKIGNLFMVYSLKSSLKFVAI